jgi:hypothetical protein
VSTCIHPVSPSLPLGLPKSLIQFVQSLVLGKIQPDLYSLFFNLYTALLIGGMVLYLNKIVRTRVASNVRP